MLDKQRLNKDVPAIDVIEQLKSRCSSSSNGKASVPAVEAMPRPTAASKMEDDDGNNDDDDKPSVRGNSTDQATATAAAVAAADAADRTTALVAQLREQLTQELAVSAQLKNLVEFLIKAVQTADHRNEKAAREAVQTAAVGRLDRESAHAASQQCSAEVKKLLVQEHAARYADSAKLLNSLYTGFTSLARYGEEDAAASQRQNEAVAAAATSAKESCVTTTQFKQVTSESASCVCSARAAAGGYCDGSAGRGQCSLCAVRVRVCACVRLRLSVCVWTGRPWLHFTIHERTSVRTYARAVVVAARAIWCKCGNVCAWTHVSGMAGRGRPLGQGGGRRGCRLQEARRRAAAERHWLGQRRACEAGARAGQSRRGHDARVRKAGGAPAEALLLLCLCLDAAARQPLGRVASSRGRRLQGAAAAEQEAGQEERRGDAPQRDGPSDQERAGQYVLWLLLCWVVASERRGSSFACARRRLASEV